MSSQVDRVFQDYRTQRVIVDVENGDERLRYEFCPHALHDVVRTAIGPSPYTPSASDMKRVITGSLLGIPWEDPRVKYKKAAVAVIQEYVQRHLCGATVSTEAAGAMLDGKDWPERDF